MLLPWICTYALAVPLRPSSDCTRNGLLALPRALEVKHNTCTLWPPGAASRAGPWAPGAASRA
eukprot:5939700-Lingulodinium_polyedra.AAC.1